jgi:hypothetical protein
MKRPVWLVAGVALGVGGTLWAEQRVRRAARKAVERFTPEHVAAGARQSVREAGDRLRSAVDAGREARAEREAELWDELEARAAPASRTTSTHRRSTRASVLARAAAAPRSGRERR